MSAAFAVLSAGPPSESEFLMTFLSSFSWERRAEAMMKYCDERYTSCLLPLKNIKQCFLSSLGGRGKYCKNLCGS